MTAAGAESAALLPYRFGPGGAEFLIAHPGGPFWAKRDAGAWSIVKGEVDPGEDLLAAARREFAEETGAPAPDGPFLPLGSVRQRSGKTVHCWAVGLDFDPEQLVSNTYTQEWPPRSGRTAEFPEIDRVGWCGADEAKRRLNPAQAEFIDRCLAAIG